jgi:hypothetical protein
VRDPQGNVWVMLPGGTWEQQTPSTGPGPVVQPPPAPVPPPQIPSQNLPPNGYPQGPAPGTAGTPANIPVGAQQGYISLPNAGRTPAYRVGDITYIWSDMYGAYTPYTGQYPFEPGPTMPGTTAFAYGGRTPIVTGDRQRGQRGENLEMLTYPPDSPDGLSGRYRVSGSRGEEAEMAPEGTGIMPKNKLPSWVRKLPAFTNAKRLAEGGYTPFETSFMRGNTLTFKPGSFLNEKGKRTSFGKGNQTWTSGANTYKAKDIQNMPFLDKLRTGYTNRALGRNMTHQGLGISKLPRGFDTRALADLDPTQLELAGSFFGDLFGINLADLAKRSFTYSPASMGYTRQGVSGYR